MAEHAEIAAEPYPARTRRQLAADRIELQAQVRNLGIQLRESRAEITRLEAELGIAVDVAKRTAAALEKTCEREEAQRKIIDEEQEESAMWADKSNVMEAQLGEALAEIATLREALHDAKHIVVDPACEFCATPTATAREGEPSE